MPRASGPASFYHGFLISGSETRKQTLKKRQYEEPVERKTPCRAAFLVLPLFPRLSVSHQGKNRGRALLSTLSLLEFYFCFSDKGSYKGEKVYCDYNVGLQSFIAGKSKQQIVT